MTTFDYLLNGAFLLLVLRQSRERRLDRRSWLVPLVLMVVAGQYYLHSIPTAGNDLVFIAALAGLGISLGTVSGFATTVWAGSDGMAMAKVGWLAGGLLAAGISSRMVFAQVTARGFEPSVAAFSMAHHITAAAWPAALVLMALSEVAARMVTVQVRGRLATSARPSTMAAAPTAA